MRQVEQRVIAQTTIQNEPEMLSPGHRVEYPASLLPRRIVAQVLSMPTVQGRDPLLLGVLMESCNATIHSLGRLVIDEQGGTHGRPRPVGLRVVRT